MTAPVTVLSVKNLLIGYSGQAILPKISFQLFSSQVTSIVGHNGSGKSTLLSTLLGLLPAIHGSLERSAEFRVGYVPQRSMIDPIYPLRVQDIVDAGRYGIRGVGNWLDRKDESVIHDVMKSTKIFPLKDRLYRTLSGGEQQRTLLARALCTEPHLLVLDEPTASMDEKGAEEAMKLTVDLATKRQAAILMVNHFIDLVEEVSDQVIVLDRDHQAVKVGKPQEVLRGRGRVYD
jgi:ABC-type Mn2+/Zn2+ transport system ATPase subunit